MGSQSLRDDAWSVAITGSEGNDTLDTNYSTDPQVSGGGGNDLLHIGTGVYNVSGGAGDDTIMRWGNKGGDTIAGDSGIDKIDYSNFGLEYRVLTHFMDGSPGGLDVISGIEYFVGWRGPDSIVGTSGADTIDGDFNADTISGGAGDDWIISNTNAYVMTGGPGADTFSMVAGWGGGRILDFNVAEGDRIVLPDGVSYVLSQVGADTLVSMTYVLNPSATQKLTLVNVPMASVSAASISGLVNTNPNVDFKFESISPSAALAVKATDTVTFSAGTATDATVLYGTDTITISVAGRSVVFSNAVSDLSLENHLIFPDSTQLYIGLGTTNYFSGRYTADAMFGGGGGDTIYGYGGGDLLQGNQGVDNLNGGDGDDTIYGGQDNDIIDCGPGVNFGQGNRGGDSIAGGVGVDTLLGGQDNDTVFGNDGSDFLNGNRGDDSVAGGAGADTIYGESGADTLSGGGGADVFHAVADSGLDRIIDFNRAEGDRLVLDGAPTYSAVQSGADMVVSLGSGNQVVLVGVTLSSLSGDWLVVI